MPGLLNGKQLKDGSVTPNKLSEKYIPINENGEGDKFLSDDGTYKEISSSLNIADSDEVMTYDAAGLKANISIIVDGNHVRVEGKTDEEGNPYILGEFNVLQSQIIDDVYIDDATKELVITFIVDGDPGTETVRVDLTDFIDVYEGSTYIDITGQDISLNYSVLRDHLINDGMAVKEDLPTNYVTTDTNQTVTGTKTFESRMLTSNVIPRGTGYSLASSAAPFSVSYINSLNTSTITPIPNAYGTSVGTASSPFTNGYFGGMHANRLYTDGNSNSSIGSEGYPFQYGYVYFMRSANINPLATNSYVGSLTTPFTEGYFKNIYKDGVSVATVDDLVDLDGVVQTTGDQEINGTKTFNGVPVFNAGSAMFKTPLLSGGSISAGDSKLVSDVDIEAPNLAYDADVVKLTGNQTIAGTKTFQSTMYTGSIQTSSTSSSIGGSGNSYRTGYIRDMYTSTMVPTSTTNSYIGQLNNPYINGYFTNLYVDKLQVIASNYIKNTITRSYTLANSTNVNLITIDPGISRNNCDVGIHLVISPDKVDISGVTDITDNYIYLTCELVRNVIIGGSGQTVLESGRCEIVRTGRIQTVFFHFVQNIITYYNEYIIRVRVNMPDGASCVIPVDNTNNYITFY